MPVLELSSIFNENLVNLILNTDNQLFQEHEIVRIRDHNQPH